MTHMLTFGMQNNDNSLHVFMTEFKSFFSIKYLGLSCIIFNILYVRVIRFEWYNSFNMVIIWECTLHNQLNMLSSRIYTEFYWKKNSFTKWFSFMCFLNIFISFLIMFIYASVIFLLYRTIIKHPGSKRYLKLDNGIKIAVALNKILPISWNVDLLFMASYHWWIYIVKMWSILNAQKSVHWNK